MTKSKSKAIVMAADGAGGMSQIRDRRFEKDDWPINFEVPQQEADDWFHYVSAACTKRGWTMSSLAQIEAKENSGSVTVDTANLGQLAIVWERKRNGPIRVRARSSGLPELSLDLANELFREIQGRSATGVQEQFHCTWLLKYEGLPWRGELWMNDALRLGPPSQQDETALLGPRIVLVNALVNGVNQQHASSSFIVKLRELSVFLTVVLGKNVSVSPNGGRGWTWNFGTNGQVECAIHNLGYFEKQFPIEMPTEGHIHAVPLRAVRRPDFSLQGIDGTQSELHIPEDLLELWRDFGVLPLAGC